MNAPSLTQHPSSTQAIGQRLRLTREALGYAQQAAFCRATEIGTNTYNQWETGTIRPSLDGAIQLCRRWGMTLDWIYFGDVRGMPYELANKLRSAA